ncbi:MAG TPA: hypothetical protein VGQ95_04230 [Chthoniobacterales bacterium]|nr:hypothetical protein [Chthoniobacterales bacterium]
MVTKSAGDRRAVFIVCIFLTAITWAVFAQTVHHEFINFDDDKYVYENAQVRSGLSFHGIIWAFTHSHASLWHPLTTITHMLDCQVFGLWAGGHHLVNVLLHNIAAVLLFLVLRQMTGSPSSPRDESVRLADRTGSIWRSAFVAAIFAIHPLRVESVAWIAERKDVLSAVFFMLTLGAYARYVRKPTLGRYVTMSILFACGLMSKATFVAVPLVLLLLDYWPLNRGQKSGSETQNWLRLLAEKIPLLVLSAASAAATAFAQTVTMASLQQLPLLPRIKNAIVSTITYIGQTFWPVDLGIFYPHPHDQLKSWLVLLSVILIVGISLIAIFTRRKRPYVLVGWCWYLGMLAPVLGIVQAGLQGHADRFTYLPHVGLSILLTWAIADLTERWRHRKLILGASAAVVIAALAASAWRQTTCWRDCVSIWTRTLTVTSNNSIAHQDLAAALWDRGRIQEAHTHSQIAEIIRWQTVLKDYPLDIAAHNALGVLLVQSGKPREAIAQWEISLEIDPNDGNAQNNLAWVLATSPEDAIRDGRRAVELAEKASRLPGGETPIVLRTLAAAYAETGESSKAIDTARRAAELAMAQQNQSLVETLQSEMELYRVNKPHRELPQR